MTRKDRANYVMEALAGLYPTMEVPLEHKDPYTLLIAVLLSAQCTDARVNQVSPKLFAKADNPQAMVRLSISEIAAIIKPCGLSPAKSKAIFHLSERLLNEQQGSVPADMDYLESLPGVGHKTASVVMAQAFQVPAFPVDTHIHRMMYRWALSKGSSVVQTEADAKNLFPRERWNDLHLQIIFYGREYSPARGLDLRRDFITRRIGRKSLLRAWHAKHPDVDLSAER